MDAVDYLRQCVLDGRVSRDDLMHAFGSRSRLSEIMNKRRGLTTDQIRRLRFDIGLDADMLLKPVRIGQG